VEASPASPCQHAVHPNQGLRHLVFLAGTGYPVYHTFPGPVASAVCWLVPVCAGSLQAKRKRDRMGDLKIVVAGCVAQQEGEQLLRRVPEVDLVMGKWAPAQHSTAWSQVMAQRGVAVSAHSAHPSSS
jgi:hypothetical protein